MTGTPSPRRGSVNRSNAEIQQHWKATLESHRMHSPSPLPEGTSVATRDPLAKNGDSLDLHIQAGLGQLGCSYQ